MIEWISKPWPWYVAGPAIAGVLFLLLWFGKSFGVSSTLRTVCALGGGGKCNAFFDFNWRSQVWNIVFAIGTIAGGFIAANLLSHDEPVELAAATVADLQTLGIDEPGGDLVPAGIFSWSGLFTPAGFILIVVGGFLVGFGARYAGGCTSGHAISGLSNLQLPSLLAVVGFFLGGLAATHFVLPIVLS